ncbi:membrane protein BRI3-like [Artemia franciscana]|uniref:Membrane protein BRI3 n=2 Tax=Artemia franciscana TaxID=6661 RepID=B0FWR2_ARTSF|nr:brain protein I3 [Artemia franciscana]
MDSEKPPAYAPPPYSSQEPPPIGFNYAQPQPQYQPQPQPQVVRIQTVPSTTVILANGCPSCRNGVMVGHFPCCAIFIAILFFPLGVLCCLLMRVNTCSSCGFTT